MDLTNWEAANKLVRDWEIHGQALTVSLPDALDRWYEDCEARNLSSDSLRKYKRLKGALIAQWGDKQLRTLTVDDVRKMPEGNTTRLAAKPKLVQITTAYGKPAEGSPVVPRNQYVEIRQEKPKNKYQQDAPEYKTCKYTTEAIVADGTEKGELRKVCANPDCPVHHPKKQQRRADPDAATKAAQEKQRREEAIANTTGIRVLAAIAEAVPVRLMKRDLLFVVERLAGLVEERRLEIVAKQHGVKREKDSDSIVKLFAASLRRAEESVLGSALVELTVLLAVTRQQTKQVLNEAAAHYKVDTDAIAAKVKQEFAAKDKAKTAKKAAPKSQTKATKKVAA